MENDQLKKILVYNHVYSANSVCGVLYKKKKYIIQLVT